MAASSLFIIGALLGSATAQSGCYNAAGDHASVCTTEESACTGTWTSSCGCSRVDPTAAAKPECSLDTTYHMHGGYYIEGVNGVDNGNRGVDGKRADKTEWSNGTYYPHGEMKLCTGVYCSEADRTVGSAQHVYAHTCAKLRFTYAADSGSTVYEMPTKAAFDACDFTAATLKCAADAGSPCDVHYEANDEQKVYYYASENACATSQKIAVDLNDHFSDNYAQCSGMGAGSSRIQHCDCDHHIRGTTLIEPCFSGFVNGCKADMPDDLSCCPGADASSSGMSYVNGGQCIAKSDLEGFKDVAERVHDMMHCNQTQVDEHAAMEECPKVSMYSSAREPVCAMVKKVLECDVPSPAADCAKERTYKLFVEHTNTRKTPVCPVGSPALAKTTTLTSILTLAGTLASLTNTDKLNIKKTIAKGAGVKHSAVSVAYAAGSVVVTATIAVADAAAATAAAKSLNEGIMASDSALTAALQAEGVTAAVEAITVAQVYSPPAAPSPPPAVPSPPPADSDDGLSVGAIVGIAVGVVVGALALIGLLVVVVKKQKGGMPAKKIQTAN